MNPFEQIVVTCHEPPSIIGANEYRVARRHHLGPFGIEVTAGSIQAKYSPDVRVDAERIVVSSYAGRVLVTVP